MISSLANRIIIMLLLLSSTFIPGLAQIKGCPFDKFYSFGDYEFPTSDGSCSVDHLASAFHLPIPDHYMKKEAKFDYGASFAARGSTVMGTLFFLENGLGVPNTDNLLRAQVNAFTAYLHSICYDDQQNCKENLQRALFYMNQMGTNDYKYAFLQGKSIAEVTKLVPQVTEGIRDSIRKLIEAGANYLLVPGSIPMGCQPGYFTLFPRKDPKQYNANHCHRGLNMLSKDHNNNLRMELFGLRKEYPHAQIVYADFYNAFMALLRNHLILGFKKNLSMKACCGIGGQYNFDKTRTCGSDAVPVCSDPEAHIHWDGFHLTKEANKLIVEALISGKDFVYPEFKFPEVMHCTM